MPPVYYRLTALWWRPICRGDPKLLARISSNRPRNSWERRKNQSGTILSGYKSGKLGVEYVEYLIALQQSCRVPLEIRQQYLTGVSNFTRHPPGLFLTGYLYRFLTYSYQPVTSSVVLLLYNKCQGCEKKNYETTLKLHMRDIGVPPPCG
jgi:hypothetical protein